MALLPYYEGDIHVILKDVAFRAKMKKHQEEQKRILTEVERKLHSALAGSKLRSLNPSGNRPDK